MRVTIVVGGRFHAFDLAKQLLKRGYLERLITSYPKFEVTKHGIPRNKTSSIFIKEVLQRSWQKLPRFARDLYNPQHFINVLFDKLASRNVSKSDIFVGWASKSLYSLRRARKQGAIIVIEQGSAHIEYQTKILREEYEKFGLKFETTHPKTTEKVLKEFEEADYISIPSLFVKRTFLEKGIPEKKLIHVPYGVDLTSFKQIPKEDDVFRVVFAGGITLQKGAHYLLRAFTELNLPKSELVFIGGLSDEMKPFFKKYEGHYNYLGHLPQSELYKHYSQGSVFVLPSIQDGFGMVIIQAMACGLPVIATENTGGPDIIEDGKNGFVIPIRDVGELKEKLTFLYENPENRKQMGQSAKKRVSSGFTWDNYGKNITDEYKRILTL